MGPMMNNPFSGLIQMIRGGGNPMGMLQNMAQQNPMIAQAMQMTSGRSPAELRQIAENMARERGVTVDQVAGSLGISLPRRQG